MSSERKEKRTPIIYDLFPISQHAATEAVRAIAFFPKGQPFKRHFLRLSNSIRTENPEIVRLLFIQLNLLDQMLGHNDATHEANIWLGTVYMYQALKSEAQAKGGRLPTINSNTIQAFQVDSTTLDGIPVSNIKVNNLEDVVNIAKMIGGHLDRKIQELPLSEPHLMDGFERLIQTIGVSETDARIAKGSAYQIFAIFKTYSEIQKVRRILE